MINVKIKKSQFSLFIAFATILFWDLIEKILPNFQFVIISFLLIINLKYVSKYITQKFLFFASIVFLHGVINVILKNNIFTTFLIQYGSIIISYLAFACVLDKFDSKIIFKYYWKSAYVLSLYGCMELLFSIINIKIPILFLNTTFESKVVGLFPRIASLCSEPSFVGYFLAPAVFMIIYSLVNKNYNYIEYDDRNKIIQSVAIILVYIMTFSTIAYIGLVCMFIYIWLDKGISWGKIIIPIIGITFVIILYRYIPDFKMRIDDTYKVFFSNKISSGSINLSSYTYYSNSRVFKETLKTTKGLGTGLGSYRYLFDIYNIGAWGNSGLSLNREDGNSMIFRIGSELGIVGLLVVFIFLVRYIPHQRKDRILSLALLSMFSMIILRMGNYTHGGIWLYIVLYIKIYNESKIKKG